MFNWDVSAIDFITDGTDRCGRVSPALQPNYFNVDELVFEQLLAMGAEFAAQVNFINLNNKVDGNWAGLLTADEAVIMAMILSSNLEKMEAQFSSLVALHPTLAANYILQTATRINFWINKLDRHGHEAGDALGYKLNGLVEEKLAQELHTVAGIASLISKNDESISKIDFAVFTPVWGVKKSGEKFIFPHARGARLGGVSDTKRELRAAFYVFYNAISYMKIITPIYLQESLGSQMHEPSAGLFMVFLKLYEKAQESVNRFTPRHLDFYYKRVLQAKPRMSKPESAHLLLEVLPGMNGTLIEKGLKFSAGAGEHVDEIIYCANSDLWVSDVKVAALHTLYLQHNNLIAPESELGYITRIKQEILTPSLINSESTNAWPLFGEEKPDIEKRAAVGVEIGFSIATPLLQLDEGERRVELSIIFDNSDGNDADTLTADLCWPSDGLHQCPKEGFFKQFGHLFSRYLLSPQDWMSRENKNLIIAKAADVLERSVADDIAQLLNKDWQALFYQLLKNAFFIQLTTDDGWFEVQDYTVTPYCDGSSDNTIGFNVEFHLGREIGAIVPYLPNIHGVGIDTIHPLLKCCINPQSSFYPYSLFADLLVKTVDLEVSAQGVKNLQLHNNHGQLDPTKPFSPFGPIPGRNSYLIFGYYEMAKKRLVDLTINLEWGELPTGSGGFSKHYSGYDTKLNNNSFKASFETMADGHWLPQDMESAYHSRLFDSQGEGELTPHKSLDVNVLGYAKPISAGMSRDDYQYGLTSRNGFFKLSLREPVGMFAHAEYSDVLARVLTQNARLKLAKPTPNVPHTPTLNSVSLDYRAQSRIRLRTYNKYADSPYAEKIFHHHPFGINSIHPNRDGQAPSLFPQYKYRGNLYIGLSGNKLRGSVTLFFHLSEDHEQELASEAARFDWFYLGCDGWKRLPSPSLIRDTTHGFLSSGVITLNLPDDIVCGNREMPGDLYWLRLSSEHEVKGLCSCYTVYCNAVPVTRQLQDGVEQQEVASNNAKWQPMASIPGIGNVTQVGQLFGGKAEESTIGFRTRVSEQLRHKNRASTPWDYERLVLDNFDGVAKVKCFSNMRSDRSTPAPGHVLVVVVPNVDNRTVSASSRAMVGLVELNEIRAFLLRNVATGVKVDVRNPVYEQVQIRCTVKFASAQRGVAWGNRFNHDISDYLSPWRDVGYKSRFGWTIQQKDIESYIRDLEYIEFVTNFSMLHITSDGSGNHFLDDTARPEKRSDNSPEERSEKAIGPRFPWSLVIPADHHPIETMQTIGVVGAETAGINELEIGRTFIINGRSENGEEE